MQLTEIPNIVQGIKKYYTVSNHSLQQLAANFTEQQLPKHTLLTQSGVKSNHVYFIEQGCARTYFIVNGKEITNWISTEGTLTFSSASLYHQKAGYDNVVLAEDSLVYTLPITTLNNLYTTHIDLANWSRCIHQEVLLQMQNLRMDRLSLSAEERYRKLFAEHPDWFNRINLGHIASYLGMSQQYLSNLRAEVRF